MCILLTHVNPTHLYCLRQGLFTTKLVHKNDSLVSINRQHELYTAPLPSWLAPSEQARPTPLLLLSAQLPCFALGIYICCHLIITNRDSCHIIVASFVA